MKAGYTIACITIILLFTVPGIAQGTATIHGVAYEWNTFSPLKNTILWVNSTPEQSIVAKYGVYSFELPDGCYLITASCFEDEELIYYGENTISVSGDGSYIVDLLLLPSYTDEGTQGTNSYAQAISSLQAIAVSLAMLMAILIN